MTDIKIQQVKYFLAIIKHGGFRKAAIRLNRTQAAVSSGIQVLEKSLGHKLFESKYKAELTQLGMELVSVLEMFVQNNDLMVAEMERLAKGERGCIKVVSVPSFAKNHLPQILKKLSKTHPELKIELIDATYKEAYEKVINRQADCAIANLDPKSHILRAGKDPLKAIDFQPLNSDSLGVVCTRQHELIKKHTEKGGITLENLLAFPFIYNHVCELLENTPLEVLNHHASYIIPNITSLVAAVEQGLGITILPKQSFGLNSTLQWLPIKGHSLYRNIGIYHLKSYSLKPAVQTFIKHARETMLSV